MSGIKAHTIRIWEKRYQLIVPSRSPTNIRSYSDNQLKKILNVASLISLGYKISKISEMSKSQMLKILEHNQNELTQTSPAVVNLHQMTQSCLNFDERTLDQQITLVIAKTSLIRAFSEVFFPLLSRIGFLWAANKISPAHEHFLSNKLKQVLYSAMNVGKENELASSPTLLYLPEWEEHEILLLFCNYLLKHQGNSTIYLGAKVPLPSLIETIKSTKTTRIVTVLTTPNYQKEAQRYLKKICKQKSIDSILLCGSMPYKDAFIPLEKTQWVSDTSEFLQAISHSSN
ncbi:hypothetical protein BFP72_09765 [Reichenbachiella sp. 5M10]|nr:hypothetical protein BFP72_09765 [Reichenbachiella sp. 5M10]